MTRPMATRPIGFPTASHRARRGLLAALAGIALLAALTEA